MDHRCTRVAGFAFVVLLCSGCATMIRGTKEKLEVTTEPPGATIDISDGRTGISPCQFECPRNKTLIVTASMEGYQTETITVTPTLAGGGVLLGGLIDYGTGAVYNLTPNPVHLLLNPIAAQEPTPPSEVHSLTDQLRDLETAREAGLITEEEYQECRKQILGPAE